MVAGQDDSCGKVVKRKRVNKNKKKNWRKHVDISDVEKALENERFELRTGGIISDKPDAQIFFVDKTTGTDNETKVKKRQDKVLRCDQIITPEPNAICPPRTTSRRSKKRQEKVAEKRLTRKMQDIKVKKSSRKPSSYDLWASEGKELYDKEMKKKDVDKYTEVVVGNASYARPKYLESKPGDVEGYKYRNTPAVEVAHAGASYNPTYEDHQDLLAAAHEIEVDKEKKQKRIERALHVPYEELPDLDTLSHEMKEGLFESGEHNNEQDTKEDDDVLQNPPVRAIDRKSTRKRKREAREKLEKEQKEKEWMWKLRENEVFRTKTYLAQIRAKERKDSEKRAIKRQKTRLMTLSDIKFTQQDIELKLSDEIKGSLRELKPEAGLLTDRYKSFQKRGIVEPRCKRNKPKRKKKVKYQEKRSFREIEC